jgi:hypothetical protein
MQKRILGASLAATVLFVTAFTGTASAGLIKALRLQVAGTPVPVGAPIVASSSNLTISNAFWSMTCTESTLTGTIGQNNKAKDDFMKLPEGQFLGGGNEGRCSDPFEFVTAWLPESPAELILERRGNAQLRFPRIRMTPLEDINKPPGQHEACVAASNALATTFQLSATPQPLTITFTNAKMHLESSHGQECGHGKGHSPMLSATFTFTSEGQEVDDVIFEHG